MTTGAVLVDETLRHLYSGTREQVNVLLTTVDADDTDLVMTNALNGIQAGALIALDLEECYVTSVNDQTATVLRAYNGSTAASHDAGTRVHVNPKFSRFRVFTDLNHELASLSAPTKGLFKTTYVDLTYQPAFQGYDLTSVTSIERILEVRAERQGGHKQWDSLGRTKIQLQRQADTGDFASGFSLQLLDGDAGRTVKVIYAAPFTLLTTEATDVNTTCGLPSTANDIPSLGTALRLSYPREVSRNFHETQGEPRRGQEVAAGANLNAGAGIARLYQERVREEASRLQRAWPLRRYA